LAVDYLEFSMHAVIKTLAVLALASSAFAASAQSASSGFYAGGEINRGTLTDFGSKVGVGANVGYAFNQNVAVELSAANVGTYSVNGVDLSTQALTGSVVASLPVSNDISLFGRLGYGKVTVAVDGAKGSVNSAAYGLGASYKLNNNMSLRAEYTRYAEELSKFGVGVQFKF
jgi:opacity protein-like surface antigen